MAYELITGDSLPVLDYVIIRLVLAGSILNPLVYATFSKTYRVGYQRVFAGPLQVCGVEWWARKPLGLSGSEMQRISHRMALDEWESPGLIRRQYSNRKTKKRRQNYRNHHVYTVSDAATIPPAINGDKEATKLREGAIEHRYRKNHERDRTPSTQGEEEVDREAAQNVGNHKSVQAEIPLAMDIADAQVLQQATTSVHVPELDSPGLFDVPSPMREPPTFTRTSPDAAEPSRRKVLEQQLSDSGIDMDSLQCESLPSATSSPNVIRLHSRDLSLILHSDFTNSPHPHDVTSGKSSEQTQGEFVIKMTDKDVAPSDIHLPRSRTDSLHNSSMRIPGDNIAEPTGNGHVCIHVQVIEYVDRQDMTHEDGSLVSTVRQCKLSEPHPSLSKRDRPASPSFVFSLRENRFVPEEIEHEEVDTYSCHYGNDLSPYPLGLPKVRSTPNLQVSSESSSSRSPKDAQRRPKRTSEVLRQSSRYSDDIVRFNDLMLQDQLQDLQKESERSSSHSELQI